MKTAFSYIKLPFTVNGIIRKTLLSAGQFSSFRIVLFFKVSPYACARTTV